MAEETVQPTRTLNWPLAVAAAGALYFGLKLLTAAGGDIPTALEMANLLDFLPTVTAMIISVSPMMLLPIYAAFVPFLLHGRGSPGTLRFTLHVSVLSALAIGALLFSAPGVVLLALAIVAFWVVGKLGSRKKWKHAAKFEMTFDRVETWTSGIVLVTLFFGPSWLAPQALQLEGEGEKTVYVVSQDERRLIYLEERSKRIKRIEADKVLDQNYCSAGYRAMSSPIYGLLQPGERNPDCPGITG